ncbi:MAG: hypothetical protein PHP93_02845 [Kiritimatiellales bacterium]|nr:hypothetical protein [Kiritimatiellales bacterium]
MRYITALVLAALVFSVAAAKAENMPKMKMKGKMDAGLEKNAECKMSVATNDAACTMEQKKEQMKSMEKQQMKKAEEMKKEAGKGSEKGQAMREEHSKKWWKLWGDKTEE